MKFRKKPVVIEAERWDNDLMKIDKFFGKFKRWEYKKESMGIIIDTLEGKHRASIGDWIIKGVKGEFYPCKPDIFEETYEKVKNQ